MDRASRTAQCSHNTIVLVLVVVLVLENPDRFAIRLTEQISCRTSVSLRSRIPMHRGRARVRLKNENEVRGRDFEGNLVLDRSFLLPLNRSEAPNRTRTRARPRPRILLGRSENIKDREPLSRPCNPDLASSHAPLGRRPCTLRAVCAKQIIGLKIWLWRNQILQQGRC